MAKLATISCRFTYFFFRPFSIVWTSTQLTFATCSLWHVDACRFLSFPNESMRLVMVTVIGAVFGFFIGISFLAVNITKIYVITNPKGAEGLAPGIVVLESYFHLCRLWGDPTEVVHQWPGLPKGVKFDPSDQELVWHLLAKHGKVGAKPHPFIDEFIPTVEEDDGICYTHLQKLPAPPANS